MQPTRRTFLASLSAAGLAAPLAAVPRAQRDMLRFTARPTAPDAEAFFRAVRAGDAPEVARQVAERPALLEAGDERGRSGFAVALLAGRTEVARVLREAGYEPDGVEAAMVPDWELCEQRFDEAPELLNAYHPVGGTALYAAVRAGSRGVWRLQSWGADSDGNPLGRRFGRTPAAGALQCPDPRKAAFGLVALLSNGASVHARQPGGDTLLHLAAARDDAYLVSYVIRRGAAVSARNDRGETALALAERLGHDQAAEVLRSHADVPRDNVRLRYAYDASGGPVEMDPLWDVPRELQGRVTGASHAQLPVVRELLGQDRRLVFSFSSQDELAIEACGHTGNREILKLHLDHGAPQSVATSISLGDLDRARALLDEDPTAIHERGPHDFALMWYCAIGGGSVEAAELLVERGAPVDQESLHTTALHWAASRGQADLARFLVERGADVNRVGYKFSAEGQTPLAMAEERGHDGTARLLKELGAR